VPSIYVLVAKRHLSVVAHQGNTEEDISDLAEAAS
jgi:hypothetical protein